MWWVWLTYVVQHLECVVEVVFVGFAIAGLDAFECSHFGQDDGEQAATAQFDEADTGNGRHHDFIEFVDDALLRDNLNAFGVAPQSILRLFLYLESQLCSEAYAAHHAEGVVAERDVGVEGSGDDAVLEVEQSVEEVDEFAVATLVEADGKRIDGEVAAVEVVVECAVLDDGLAAVALIALAACADEFYLLLMPFQLRRAEVAEDADVCSFAEFLCQRLGETYAASLAHHHHVDVLRGTFQDDVPHITANDVALHAQRVGCLADAVQQGSVDGTKRVRLPCPLPEVVVFLYGVN